MRQKLGRPSPRRLDKVGELRQRIKRRDRQGGKLRRRPPIRTRGAGARRPGHPLREGARPREPERRRG
eukprot:14121561-Alexandrium_andersonii.AAC.1